MLQLPAPLAPLGAYRQFVVCQFVPDLEKPGKTKKYPINVYTGERHDAHDPAVWIDHAYALQVANAWNAANTAPNVTYGIGFTFTTADPFFFVDVDECLVDGAWTPIVSELCGMLPGAAVEISHSGIGLHIIATGDAGPAETRRKKDYTNKLFDLYTDGRFVALTGTSIIGDAATVHTPALHAIVEKHLRKQPGETAAGWTTGPCPEWRGSTDDAQLIERAMRSHSAAAAFGNRASFADLWTGNLDVLGRAYPPDRQGDTHNASTADSALAQHLAFWTGRDCERIKRLMMQSALVRDKWIQREADYLDLTILNVCARQVQVCEDKLPEPLAGVPALAAPDLNDPVPAPPPQPTRVSGSTFLSVDDQLNLFRGCVYVVDQNRALGPGGVLLKPDQFRAVYGGYTLTMDNANERTSRDAWEAFTQSQSYRAPRADSTTFRPDRPPGDLVRDAGRVRVNVWWPVEVPRQVGDAGPFLRHLEKVLPDARDRRILLSYMAAVVQHKGVKFQWAPLLQGTEGNGKTLFARCVAEAVGKRYTHWPKASQIASPFNAWLLYKVFIAVEDIYVPDSKREVIEELKPMITGGDGLEIQAKGIDQISADICANFMFNSNHKDAIRKTKNDRRFCVMYTAQQSAEDVLRDGMGGDYFPNLYTWLRGGGYAIVSELLYTMPIDPEFNPAGTCQRAPLTSSTEQAIEAGLGRVEQEVLEAISQGQQGFAGGWVSSMALDLLLEEKNASRALSINKRRELMQALGYDWHPGLKDGRVNNIVLPDQGKPRLFIVTNHPSRGLTVPAEIARAYEAAQGVVGFAAAAKQ